MADSADSVRQHYAISGLMDRVDAFLRERGVDPERPSYEDFFPFDQLHGRGVHATREHIERAGIAPGMRVLDLGCGVGGASRVIAATCGCRVSGLDLTPEFIEAARELTRRCGQAGAVEFLVGDALSLPFADGAFDHVLCHNVTMNIPDKSRLAAEVVRVLRPGGRFSCSEVAQGPAGPPLFPLPWAADESASFLLTPEETRAALTEAGLRIIETSITRGEAGATGGEATPRASHVIIGDDYRQRAANLRQCEREGRVVEHFVVAEKLASDAPR